MTLKDEESWLEQARWVRALARDVLRDTQLAEDVTQEALLAAWRGGSAPMGDPTGLRSWLAATARNLARMTRRSESNRRVRERDVAAQRPNSTDPIDERIKVQRRVAEALAALPPEDREVIVLRYFDGLPAAEIARRLDTTPNAVSTRLSRARKKLRTGLGEPTSGGRNSSPSWAFIALGMGYPSVASVAVTSASPTVATSNWLLPLAMKKIIAAAVALTLLLLGGLWLTAGPSETNEVRATAPRVAAAAPVATLDSLVEIESPSPRADLSLPGPRPLEMEPREPEVESTVTGSVLVKVISNETKLPVQTVGLSLISMTTSRWFDSQTGRTDGKGERWFHDLPAAKLEVRAWRTGTTGDASASSGIEVIPGETVEVTLQLSGGKPIIGRVVDESDRAFPNAEIWISQGNGGPTTSLLAGYSDEQGRFEIPHTMNLQAVGARAHGAEPSVQKMPHVVKPNDPEIGTKLVLRGLGGQLSGRVVDREDQPVGGALVRVERLGPPLAGQPIVRESGFVYAPAALMLRAGADGAFTTNTMGSGSFLVTARGRDTDVMAEEVNVAPGGQAEIELRVASAGSLRGVVTDYQGMPVAGAYVSAMGADWSFCFGDAITDGTGAYALPSLQTGPVEVTVMAERGKKGIAETVHIHADGETVWSPSLPAPLAIVGRALSVGGTPLTGFHVRGSASAETGPMARFQVDVKADGSFEAPNCFDAEYDLSLQLPGQWMGDPLLELKAVRAGSVDSEFVLAEASLPSSSILGSVVDLEDHPVAFTLTVEGHDPLVLIVRRFRESDGRFELPYLPQGQYKLTFAADGFVSSAFDLASPLLENEVREIPEVRLARQP